MALRLRLLIIPSILALWLAACAPAASTSPSAAGTAAGSAPAYPVSLTDDASRSVNLPGLPDRIVSLAPSNSEIVCALGACDHLVGVTDFDDYPPQVSDVAKVVVGAQVDVEKVVDANPQLILAAGNELTPTSVVTQLADLGYPVLVLYPESLDELYADIELVGRAIDASAEAADVVDGMRTRAQAVANAVATAEKPRTFYEVGVFQGTIYTAGADSFLASLISIAGGDPITGDARSTAIQLEDLVAADPQLILLGDAAYDPSVTSESVASRPGWEAIAAVRDGHIVVVADDPVITRPGPRIIDGLEALARAIHPELFS
ncbi:MAG: ABC transporter substrate-binding protein [Chloroflexi bacterium]|nr:ABC transporter substrate-binding protein [Chloroflexota bacterium]